MSHFGLNLGQTAEDSDMFTNIWLSSKGLIDSVLFPCNSIVHHFSYYFYSTVGIASLAAMLDIP